MMTSEIVVATYNNPAALRLTLLSVAKQACPPTAICIAEDGSDQSTAEVIENFRNEFDHLHVRHAWHEDVGFEKNAILNNAISTSECNYLIFTDGDCLLHPGFVARHLELAAHDRFCTGSVIRLSDDVSNRVSEDDVLSGRVFEIDWLQRNGALKRFSTYLKAMPYKKPVMSMLERLSPIRRSWSGGNASCFREAIVRVNGFDETMKYGGEDKELGVRLKNAGLKGRHLRYSAPMLHLEHPRGYVTPEIRQTNREKIRQARKSGVTWTNSGIEKRAT